MRDIITAISILLFTALAAYYIIKYHHVIFAFQEVIT